jgi:osmotically-inducible protein OsmY
MKTDGETKREIEIEIQKELRLEGSDIICKVSNGQVTLIGTTDSYPKKSYAEKAAKKVPEVKSVRNNMEVKISGVHKRSDAEIKEAVRNIIFWNSEIDGSKITITVKSGIVTLEGTVSWEYQRTRAKLLAEDTAGVVKVNNLIKVIPPLPINKEIKKINSPPCGGVWIVRLR